MNLIYPYFIKNRIKILIGFLCMLIVNLAQIYIPQIVKTAIDNLSTGNFDNQTLLIQCAILVGLGIAIAGLRYVWRIQLIVNASEIEKGIREKIFEQILRLDATYYASNRTGGVMARAISDIEHVRTAFGQGLMLLVDTVLLGGGTLAVMLWIHPKLAIFALMPMPILMILIKRLGTRTFFLHLTAQQYYSKLNDIVREGFLGIRIIKIFNFERTLSENVASASKNYHLKSLKRSIIYSSIQPITIFFFSISSAIILLFGGSLAIKQEITPGELAAFLQYLGLLSWPIIAIGIMMNLFQRGSASLKRINSLLNTTPEIQSSQDAADLNLNYENIQFKDANFSYNKKSSTYISDINLSIPKGNIIGITGPPGSGKTTLVKLLSRVYNLNSGQICFDDNDIFQVNLNELRNHIALMPQESFLFSDTIRQNILLGKPYEKDQIDHIIETCRLAEMINKLPQGIETMVGEKGITLSGGQKQRIALARTLILNRPVIILDDPISQVDARTASKIISKINQMKGTATIVLVSHRISALTGCDKIYILKNGKVETSGTHESLIQRNGFYQKAYTVQKFEEKHFVE